MDGYSIIVTYEPTGKTPCGAGGAIDLSRAVRVGRSFFFLHLAVQKALAFGLFWQEAGRQAWSQRRGWGCKKGCLSGLPWVLCLDHSLIRARVQRKMPNTTT